MAFDEAIHRDKVLSIRERFLRGLEAMPHLTKPSDARWIMSGPIAC
jgi:hypothetical protein